MSTTPAGYKQTEAGVIPEEWTVKPFGKLFAFSNGVNADRLAYGRGLRFINVLEPITYAHLHGPEIPGRVTVPDAVAATFSVKKGDVVFNRTSETDTELGLAATYLGSEQVVFGGFVIRGRPTDDSLDPVYSGYALRAPVIRSQIIPMGQGAVRANIGQQSLKLVLAPIPPLSEQRAIAEVLSNADALIESLEQLLAKKRHLKQATMQELLTGKKRLPGFSGAWEVKRLGELFEITSSKRVFQSEWKTEGVPFYRARELAVLGEIGRVENELFITQAMYGAFKSAHGVPEAGDMLVTGVGTLGKVYVVTGEHDFYFKDGNIIWFKIHGSMSAEFLRQLYLTPVVMKQISDASAGTTVGTYTISGANKTEIPFPPIPEQVAIAVILTDMDAEIADLEAQLAKTRTLKQGMMQKLLTGEVRLI